MRARHVGKTTVRDILQAAGDARGAVVLHVGHVDDLGEPLGNQPRTGWSACRLRRRNSRRRKCSDRSPAIEPRESSAVQMFTPPGTIAVVVHGVHLVLGSARRSRSAPASRRRRRDCARFLPTTSGVDIMPGAPEQFTLMPTTSAGVKKRAQLSRASVSPVSARMPCAIISRTVGTSTFSDAASIDFSACTCATLPGYGPGMPGCADRLKPAHDAILRQVLVQSGGQRGGSRGRGLQKRAAFHTSMISQFSPAIEIPLSSWPARTGECAPQNAGPHRRRTA